MSHTKIATKIFEVMNSIPDEQSLNKLSEVLVAQKLITKTEYKIVGSNRATDRNGIIWHFVNVSCELTVIDVESDNTLINIAFGSGIDSGDKAITKAQAMARKHAWMAALNITTEDTWIPEVDPEPEKIIVETPESKLIATIGALWKWDQALFPDYVLQRFKRPIDRLNISELSVLKSELENYGR